MRGKASLADAYAGGAAGRGASWLNAAHLGLTTSRVAGEPETRGGSASCCSTSAEIHRLAGQGARSGGFTLVPLSSLLQAGGRAKVELGAGAGQAVRSRQARDDPQAREKSGSLAARGAAVGGEARDAGRRSVAIASARRLGLHGLESSPGPAVVPAPYRARPAGLRGRFAPRQPDLLEPNYLPFMVHRIPHSPGVAKTLLDLLSLGATPIACRCPCPRAAGAEIPDVATGRVRADSATSGGLPARRCRHALARPGRRHLEGLVRFRLVDRRRRRRALHIAARGGARAPVPEEHDQGARHASHRGRRPAASRARWDPDAERRGGRPSRSPELRHLSWRTSSAC